MKGVKMRTKVVNPIPNLKLETLNLKLQNNNYL